MGWGGFYLILSIENSKKCNFERKLFGIGIRYVGETVTKKLAKHFKNIDAICDANFETLLETDILKSPSGNLSPLLLTAFKNLLVGKIFPRGMPELSGIMHSTSVILFFFSQSIYFFISIPILDKFVSLCIR